MTAVRDAPSAAIEPLPRFLHLCYLGLAFFWACSMLTFRSSILLTGAADTPQYNTLIVVVSFLANMTVLLGVSALVERAPEIWRNSRRGPSADASLSASRLSAAPAYGLPAQRFPHRS